MFAFPQAPDQVGFGISSFIKQKFSFYPNVIRNYL